MTTPLQTAESLVTRLQDKIAYAQTGVLSQVLLKVPHC
jgi:hypothetical protein